MSGYEEQLLAHAEMLEDTNELVQAITIVLAGAQRAGVDWAAVISPRAAVISPRAAARVLDPGASIIYDVGS